MTESMVAHSKNSGTLLGEGRWRSSVVKHDVEQRTVHLESAVIVMKPSSLNLFMKTLTRLRVVPTSSANVSCDILPTIGSGWPSFP